MTCSMLNTQHCSKGVPLNSNPAVFGCLQYADRARPTTHHQTTYRRPCYASHCMRSLLDPFFSSLFPMPVYNFTTPRAVGAGSTLRYIAWADSGQAFDDGASFLRHLQLLPLLHWHRTSLYRYHMHSTISHIFPCLLCARHCWNNWKLEYVLWHLQHMSVCSSFCNLYMSMSVMEQCM